jgi:NAD(P)-dependent dehydrogenase (short-subunit alcohol dehydrogenase family)
MNVILPGVIETPLSTALFADHPEFKEAMVAQHPMGHLGQASDIASAVAFLASADASFITGAELAVDGGLTAM